MKGAILPQPLSDPADFVSAEDAGLADVSFLTFSPDSAHHIGANGVFFSFETEVLALGAGQLWFNYTDASQFNPDAPENPIFITPAMGSALDFRAVVPEPAAWVLLAVAGLAAIPYFLRGRFHTWHSRSRLCELSGTAGGGCATESDYPSRL